MSSTPTSPAQEELSRIFHHGSEEKRSTPSRGNTTIPESDQDSDDEVTIGRRNRDKNQDKSIEELGPEDLSLLLDEIGAGEQATRTVIQRGISGRTFCEISWNTCRVTVCDQSHKLCPQPGIPRYQG